MESGHGKHSFDFRCYSAILIFVSIPQRYHHILRNLIRGAEEWFYILQSEPIHEIDLVAAHYVVMLTVRNYKKLVAKKEGSGKSAAKEVSGPSKKASGPSKKSSDPSKQPAAPKRALGTPAKLTTPSSAKRGAPPAQSPPSGLPSSSSSSSPLTKRHRSHRTAGTESSPATPSVFSPSAASISFSPPARFNHKVDVIVRWENYYTIRAEGTLQPATDKRLAAVYDYQNNQMTLDEFLFWIEDQWKLDKSGLTYARGYISTVPTAPGSDLGFDLYHEELNEQNWDLAFSIASAPDKGHMYVGFEAYPTTAAGPTVLVAPRLDVQPLPDKDNSKGKEGTPDPMALDNRSTGSDTAAGTRAALSADRMSIDEDIEDIPVTRHKQWDDDPDCQIISVRQAEYPTILGGGIKQEPSDDEMDLELDILPAELTGGSQSQAEEERSEESSFSDQRSDDDLFSDEELEKEPPRSTRPTKPTKEDSEYGQSDDEEPVRPKSARPTTEDSEYGQSDEEPRRPKVLVSNQEIKVNEVNFDNYILGDTAGGTRDKPSDAEKAAEKMDDEQDLVAVEW